MASPENTPRNLNCGGYFLDLSRPQIMGILNVTPDSFSDGGALLRDGHVDVDRVIRRAARMVGDGAAIIDIGGESTRPGADSVSLQQELDRVVPVVQRLRQALDVAISVDTSSPEVMREAAANGAGLINDVRALQRPGALAAAAELQLPVCLMHMQGEPGLMQQTPSYMEVVVDVAAFLQDRITHSLNAGILANNIVLDPGFGFGKTTQHNLRLLNQLERLVELGYPLLVGLSRKSLIGKVLGRDVDQRLAGSLALAMVAVARGASIVRVHDVRETADVLHMIGAVEQESYI